MAARKGSKGKGGARKATKKGGAKRSAKRAPKKSSGMKAAKRGAAKKLSAKKSSAKKSAPKRPAPKKKPKRSPIQRVTSVAKQVAQQAQAAVVGGVEALREITESVVERVGGQESEPQP